jgi:hypothetical protein
VSAPTADHNHPDYGFQRSHCPACGTAFCTKCNSYGDHLSHWPHPRPEVPATAGPFWDDLATDMKDPEYAAAHHAASAEVASVDLRALSEAATAGEWEVWDNTHGDPHIVEAGRGPITGGIALANTRDDYGRSNAAFIAAAVNHVRAELAAMPDVPDEPPFVVGCSRCGTRVSNESPVPLIVRAWVECPECVEKHTPSGAEALREKVLRQARSAIAGRAEFEKHHRKSSKSLPKVELDPHEVLALLATDPSTPEED